MKKNQKLLFILLISIIFSGNVNAQFLKKLQKTVAESVENAAIDQSANTAANKTAEVIDGSVNKATDALVNLFNKKKRKKGKKNRKQNDEQDYDQDYNLDDDYATEDMITEIINTNVDPSSLPDSYDFSWQYTLQMQTESGAMNMDYYLNPNASYFGAKPDMKKNKSAGNIIMVMDTETNTNVIFMDMKGKKMAMPSSISIDTKYNSAEVENSDNFTFEEIGTKKIMGYTCQGFKMENDDVVSIIYVTKDAPVSFTQLFSGSSKNMPKGFNSKWLDKLNNSLIMEMKFTDKKDNSVTTMKCISLDKKDFSINTNDYQFMNVKIPSFD